jgi:uncharacterized protein YndB with AHSA1/START domain
MQQQKKEPQNGSNEFTLVREFDAPRQLVFDAFTQAKHLANWWGPIGFDLHVIEHDLRPGGVFFFKMEGGQSSMWAKFTYQEIAPPFMLSYISSFSDEQGNVVRHPMSETWPMEMLSTIKFDEQNGKTIMTLDVRAINANETEQATFNEGHTSMQGGFGGTMDKLVIYLKKMQS